MNPCLLFLGGQGLRPSTEDNTPIQLFPGIQGLTSPLPICPSPTHAYCQVTSDPPHETFVMSPTESPGTAQPSPLLAFLLWVTYVSSEKTDPASQGSKPVLPHSSHSSPETLKPEKSDSPKSHSPGKETHRLDPR